MILDKTDPHAYRGNYIRIHVPTGNRYPDFQAFTSRKSFLEYLAMYNRSMPKVWKYEEGTA